MGDQSFMLVRRDGKVTTKSLNLVQYQVKFPSTARKIFCFILYSLSLRLSIIPTFITKYLKQSKYNTSTYTHRTLIL